MGEKRLKNQIMSQFAIPEKSQPSYFTVLLYFIKPFIT